jgi:uncharacterized protein YijF (DUF1287 family)
MFINLNYCIIITVLLVFFISCSKPQLHSDNQVKSKFDSTKTFNLSENQKKILNGAKKCLEVKFNYDMEMAYHVLKYRDNEFTGSAVFPNGDLDPSLGVCTDVTIRALRWGGVCDMQEEIYHDIKSNWRDYPMDRWNAKKTDRNIDHRRVPNQMVWFSKHWAEISGNDYQPGDIVAWDMNHDGWGDHIGIVSDKFVDSIPYLIHNFPDPGYVAEESVLNRWQIIGHYRIKD